MARAVTEKAPPSIRGTVTAFAIVYFLDSFVMNQGVIALITSVVIILMAVGSLFWKAPAQIVLMKVAIGLLLAPCVFATNFAQNKMARLRADEIVAAVNHYKADRGEYPKQLEELVPTYLPSIPMAKYTLMGEFRYSGTPDNPFLMYVDLPPFGRPEYWFKDQKWGYVD